MLYTLDKIIGHRGAAAYAPENTMPAFEMAWRLGCRWVEFDVMLSQDGEVFVFHDDTLQRTTNGQGQLVMQQASYIRALDAGSWFGQAFQAVRVPSLREVLTWLVEHDMQANIEIKASPTADLTLAVLDLIDECWNKNKPLPLVSSFDYQALRTCHQQRPGLPLGLLCHDWPENPLDLAEAIDAFSIHLSHKIAKKYRIERIKAAGYNVAVYTVNRRSLAFKLIDWGVDALFSDYPDLLR